MKTLTTFRSEKGYQTTENKYNDFQYGMTEELIFNSNNKKHIANVNSKRIELIKVWNRSYKFYQYFMVVYDYVNPVVISEISGDRMNKRLSVESIIDYVINYDNLPGFIIEEISAA